MTLTLGIDPDRSRIRWALACRAIEPHEMAELDFSDTEALEALDLDIDMHGAITLMPVVSLPEIATTCAEVGAECARATGGIDFDVVAFVAPTTRGRR